MNKAVLLQPNKRKTPGDWGPGEKRSRDILFDNSLSQPDNNANPQREFLNLFPANRRGWVSNVFCLAVRRGCSTPEKVVNVAISRVEHDLKIYREPRHFELFNALVAYRELALEFAKYIIYWENLPPDVKRQKKFARAEFYKGEYLSNQPPTEKQIKYLKSLGYDGKVKSKWEAMKLIDEFRRAHHEQF